MMRCSFLSALVRAGLVLVMPGLIGSASAQTPLSLAEAIDTALAQNPALASTRATGRQARETSRAARAEWFPRIQFSEGWRRSTQPVSGFGTLLNAGRFTAADFALDRLNQPGAIMMFSRRVGVSEVLFDAGRTRALVSAATHQAGSADARRQTAEAELSFRVTETYGRVLAAAAAVDAANAGVAWADEDRARADARRRAGTATDADVLAISVQLAAMRQRAVQAGGDLVSTRAALNQLMAAPLDREFTATLPPVPIDTPNLAELTRLARETRGELRDATEMVAAADAGLRAAKASLLPMLAVEAGYEWNGVEFAGRQSAWSLGAELRWNVSTGGAEVARVAASKAGADAARAARDAALAAIDLDVLTARQHWIVALARIDVSRAATADARENQRIIRQRYAAGMASMTDVLAAASAAFAADAQETANRVGAVTAWAALQRSAGRSFFSTTR